MRRDYANKRAIFSLRRTYFLTLRVVRCQNPGCSRYKQPYRPELEWHYGLPGMKFGLDVCERIYAQHLRYRSSSAHIQKKLEPYQIPITRRSIINVIRRYQELFGEERRPTPVRVIRSLKKAQRTALLDIVVAYQPSFYSQIDEWGILVRECFSGIVLATASIGSSHVEEQLCDLFTLVARQLPLPLVAVCRPSRGFVRSATTAVWPQVPAIDVTIGERKAPLR